MKQHAEYHIVPKGKKTNRTGDPLVQTAPDQIPSLLPDKTLIL